MSNADDGLVAAWLAAARRADVARELETVYAHAAQEIARRRPVCRASGRCCSFDAWGHRLYVTGLEAAYLVARLGRALVPRDVDEARARGGCPFQQGRLCGVHEIKPLGCRVYFCDPSHQDWQGLLSERALDDVRLIHERHAIAYRYAEWRGVLSMFAGAGG